MLSPPSSAKIFLATEPVDMRRGHDGLCALVRGRFDLDPYSGVLGDSEGRLVVDMYTGYNTVTRTGRRVRAGCMAHARRKLFEQSEMPGVDEALELIGKIYAVEREAKQAGIEGTDEHLELRRTRSRPLFARLLWWARGQRRSYDPRCAMGKALRYIIKNFRELGCFLRYATIPPDNNKAEAALRRVAVAVSLCTPCSSAGNLERSSVGRNSRWAASALATAA